MHLTPHFTHVATGCQNRGVNGCKASAGGSGRQRSSTVGTVSARRISLVVLPSNSERNGE